MLRTNLISCDFILPRRGQAIVWHYLPKFYPGRFPRELSVSAPPACARMQAEPVQPLRSRWPLWNARRTAQSAGSNNLLYLYTQPYDVVGPGEAAQKSI